VTFNLNSELYAAPNLAEGVDYARRHRRHERLDDTLARTDDVPKTTILARTEAGSSPARRNSACRKDDQVVPSARPGATGRGASFRGRACM
jgi:hypothetical protein